jgi:DNA-binding Lrp family transcriptional regulator
MGVPIPRGSFATSLQRLADETGMNVSTVRRWLKKFEDDKQIERIVTQRCTIIKVSNYRDYQDISEEGVNTPVNTLMNKQVNKQVNTQVNNNRRKKEEKEIKKERNIVERSAPKPSLSEVESFFDDNGYEASAFAFWQYYEQKEWKDKRGRPLDWEEKAAQWEAREYKKKGSSQDMVVPMPDYMREWNG